MRDLHARPPYMHSNRRDFLFSRSDGRGREKRWKNIIALRNNVFVKGIFFRFILFLRFAPRKGNGGKKTKICKGNGRAIIPLNYIIIYVCMLFFWIRALRTNYPQSRFWIVFWLCTRPTRDFTVNNNLQATQRVLYVSTHT